MPLSPKQLARLQKELEDQYRRLLEEVRAELDANNHEQYADFVNNDPADAGDASVADLLAGLKLSAIDRHIGELQDIEAARIRIADGSYGICVDCARDIGFDRLLAYPTAKRCLACEQLHERTYAGAGTPTL